VLTGHKWRSTSSFLPPRDMRISLDRLHPVRRFRNCGRRLGNCGWSSVQSRSPLNLRLDSSLGGASNLGDHPSTYDALRVSFRDFRRCGVFAPHRDRLCRIATGQIYRRGQNSRTTKNELKSREDGGKRHSSSGHSPLVNGRCCGRGKDGRRSETDGTCVITHRASWTITGHHLSPYRHRVHAPQTEAR
jgi:hypothetical protein